MPPQVLITLPTPIFSDGSGEYKAQPHWEDCSQYPRLVVKIRQFLNKSARIFLSQTTIPFGILSEYISLSQAPGNTQTGPEKFKNKQLLAEGKGFDYTFDELPAGYAYFRAQRSDKTSAREADYYVIGHPSGRKYRSALEWLPHLEYLYVRDLVGRNPELKSQFCDATGTIRCACKFCTPDSFDVPVPSHLTFRKDEIVWVNMGLLIKRSEKSWLLQSDICGGMERWWPARIANSELMYFDEESDERCFKSVYFRDTQDPAVSALSGEDKKAIYEKYLTYQDGIVYHLDFLEHGSIVPFIDHEFALIDQFDFFRLPFSPSSLSTTNLEPTMLPFSALLPKLLLVNPDVLSLKPRDAPLSASLTSGSNRTSRYANRATTSTRVGAPGSAEPVDSNSYIQKWFEVTAEAYEQTRIVKPYAHSACVTEIFEENEDLQDLGTCSFYRRALFGAETLMRGDIVQLSTLSIPSSSLPEALVSKNMDKFTLRYLEEDGTTIYYQPTSATAGSTILFQIANIYFNLAEGEQPDLNNLKADGRVCFVTEDVESQEVAWRKAEVTFVNVMGRCYDITGFEGIRFEMGPLALSKPSNK